MIQCRIFIRSILELFSGVRVRIQYVCERVAALYGLVFVRIDFGCRLSHDSMPDFITNICGLALHRHLDSRVFARIEFGCHLSHDSMSYLITNIWRKRSCHSSGRKVVDRVIINVHCTAFRKTIYLQVSARYDRNTSQKYKLDSLMLFL
jgi:hypothetical protein